MGTIKECSNCGNTYRYSVIEKAGTVWQPMWFVICQDCETRIEWSSQRITSFDNKPYIGKSGRERVLRSDIKEYWIQGYFKKKYRAYGFKNVKGPYEKGPDFKGIYNGELTDIEVERDCGKYTAHNHHKDSRFVNTNVLVVLNPKKPSLELRKRLPKNIVYLNIDRFVKYWEREAGKYALGKKFEEKLETFTGEFERRFFDICDDKERDMSCCPDCNGCPYNEIDFGFIAFQFVCTKKYKICSDRFKFSRILPSTIDKYFLLSVRRLL